ncbi:MAG: FAD-dependent oxidoreductase [Planctomycetes bacterium]|nr:FAD-dependent oxidoreductase [Planctomycetota bacterium]MBL7043313.1 FAD-dependent oxidoreductase [Pirellulaceae bacterium]
MNRRRFLEQCGLSAAACWYPAMMAAAQSGAAATGRLRSLTADVLVVGGGLGGCAAALAATRLGARVVMTEPTDWIGGQLTQQAVPPDEHRWIESFGSPTSYRRFRKGVRDHYRRHYALTPEAKARPNLNPGDGSVSRLCHEPRVALAVLDAMLAPAIEKGLLTVLLDTEPVGADVDGDRVRAVRVVGGGGRQETVVEAKYFIDASETGDLLPLTGTEYVTGAESKKDTGEPNASDEARPANMQSFTWCYAIDYLPDQDHTIDKPAMYDFWQQHEPQLVPPWPGRLLSLWYTRPSSGKPLELSFVPLSPQMPTYRTKTLNLWLYRRIINHANFRQGTFPGDITIVNWPQNDYMLGNLFEVSPEERAKHLDGARQLSLSLLYWLQTEAPRPDGQTGWKGLRLRKDVVGTEDGLAKFPYIRESRRIKAECTVLEQHIRPASPRRIGKQALSDAFDDSVGVGYYGLDLHPSSGGDNYFDVHCLPYQVPLGALIPQRVENLIAGCKNIGTTHLTNGAYRLHPTEWGIGEAAGALAAFCHGRGHSPRGVRNQIQLLRQFQDLLTDTGVELDWTKFAEAG